MTNATPFGFLNIDKPIGMTSHDVVARVRRVFQTRQVGHAGTLDPLASGVLIVCVGGATRLSEYVMHTTKRYRALVQFGSATATYDTEGAVTQTGEPAVIAALTPEAVTAAMTPFTGDIMQVPPAYSAIKIDGRKLYDLARKGETVTAPPRPVTIESITLTEWDASDPGAPRATLDVDCGAGTYIRSLAHDLGVALGTYAHLAGLRRTFSGGLRVEDAVTLDMLSTAPDPLRFLVPPRSALNGFPSALLDSTMLNAVQHGRSFTPAHAMGQDNGRPVMLYEAGNTNRLVAVGERRGDLIHPIKVFPQSDDP